MGLVQCIVLRLGRLVRDLRTTYWRVDCVQVVLIRGVDILINIDEGKLNVFEVLLQKDLCGVPEKYQNSNSSVS